MKSSVVTVVLVLASHPAAHADQCRATAVLDGDGALVDAIDSTLTERGIATKATAACPTTTALVERRDNAIAVTITDPSGRRSIRKLDDVNAAATLIESWARQDMNAMALVGWIEPTPLPRVADASRVDAVEIIAASPTRRRDPITLAVAGESSFGFDGTQWLGAHANACVRLGPVCGGVSGRILADDSRRSIDVLAGIEVPVALTPRVFLVAGGGAGVGSFDSPFSQNETMTTETVVGLRLDAHASFTFALTRYIGVHAGISVGGSPQAPMIIETEGDAPIDNGEPRGFVRADLGIRIGVP